MVTVPENASDPLYTNWVKEGPQMLGVVNPIVNGTGDDPTTAWQTKDKEWRMIGNQKCPSAKGAPIYGSMDFKTWYANRKTLPTENLLEDTDGLLRPPFRSVLSGAVAGCDRFLLTAALL